MENGSKALIIAGAILLAILIIGLGVYIYNQASNTIGDVGMDQMVIRQYNAQFEPYLNKELKPIEVKSLIDTVESTKNNRDIILEGITNKSQVLLGKKYITSVQYSDSGIISKIIIQEKDNQIAELEPAAPAIDDSGDDNAAMTYLFESYGNGGKRNVDYKTAQKVYDSVIMYNKSHQENPITTNLSSDHEFRSTYDIKYVEADRKVYFSQNM